MTAVIRILVVDDDLKVLTSLTRGLRLSGFEVETAADGVCALTQIARRCPDAVVLDVNMPTLDGVSVVTALRALGNEVPICMLSARTSIDDRIAGLEAGADDYLTKPFALGELVARLRALLRRRQEPVHRPAEDSKIQVGSLAVDIPGRQALLDGRILELTKREFDLLAVLAQNTGIVLSRSRLLELVWGYDFDADTGVIDVFVTYLRKKLETDGAPRVLHTVRGVGFVLRTAP